MYIYIYIYTYIYIYIQVKVKLMTVVKGDQKLSFQKLLYQDVGEGTTPFPGLLYFTLDTYLKLLSVKQVGIKYHF